MEYDSRAMDGGDDKMLDKYEKAKKKLKEVDENIKKLSGRDTFEPRFGQLRPPDGMMGERGGNRTFDPPGRRLDPGAMMTGPPRRGRGAFSRLGGRLVLPRHDTGSDDEPENKPAVQSSIVKHLQSDKSRQEKLAEENKDSAGKERNRRMFGMLLGTLQQFKSDSQQSQQTLKSEQRRNVEKKLDEKVALEKEELKRARDGLIQQRKKQRDEIVFLEHKMELTEDFKVWETETLKLMNFVRTHAHPPIFYLPKDAEAVVTKQMQETHKYVKDLVGQRKRTLKQEIDLMAKSLMIEDDGSTEEDRSKQNIPSHISMSDSEGIPVSSKQPKTNENPKLGLKEEFEDMEEELEKNNEPKVGQEATENSKEFRKRVHSGRGERSRRDSREKDKDRKGREERNVRGREEKKDRRRSDDRKRTLSGIGDEDDNEGLEKLERLRRNQKRREKPDVNGEKIGDLHEDVLDMEDIGASVNDEGDIRNASSEIHTDPDVEKVKTECVSIDEPGTKDIPTPSGVHPDNSSADVGPVRDVDNSDVIMVDEARVDSQNDLVESLDDIPVPGNIGEVKNEQFVEVLPSVDGESAALADNQQLCDQEPQKNEINSIEPGSNQVETVPQDSVSEEPDATVKTDLVNDTNQNETDVVVSKAAKAKRVAKDPVISSSESSSSSENSSSDSSSSGSSSDTSESEPTSKKQRKDDKRNSKRPGDKRPAHRERGRDKIGERSPRRSDKRGEQSSIKRQASREKERRQKGRGRSKSPSPRKSRSDVNNRRESKSERTISRPESERTKSRSDVSERSRHKSDSKSSKRDLSSRNQPSSRGEASARDHKSLSSRRGSDRRDDPKKLVLAEVQDDSSHPSSKANE